MWPSFVVVSVRVGSFSLCSRHFHPRGLFPFATFSLLNAIVPSRKIRSPRHAYKVPSISPLLLPPSHPLPKPNTARRPLSSLHSYSLSYPSSVFVTFRLPSVDRQSPVLRRQRLRIDIITMLLVGLLSTLGAVSLAEAAAIERRAPSTYRPSLGVYARC